MDSKERISIALKGGTPDRVPVVNIFNMNFLMREQAKKGEGFNGFNQDLLEKVIEFQEYLGHDPVYYLHAFQEPEMVKLPECFMKWSEEDIAGWNVIERPAFSEKGEEVTERVYSTPDGSMRALLKREKYQAWILEHPLKNKEDIRLLLHRPDPGKMDTAILESMAEKLDRRGFFTIGIPSVWQEGSALRGLDRMIYDVYDDPDWVKEFFGILADNSVKVARILGKAGIDSVFINESYVGMGMSPEMYREFVLPFDQKIISAANEAGMITSLHICGKCNALLEDMAESGATCIEPVVPHEYAGNVELADAKKRVGDKVGIWGGFKERVLNEDRESVKKEALRCIDAAGRHGGYILRGTGQIYDAKLENLMYLRELSEEYGKY